MRLASILPTIVLWSVVACGRSAPPSAPPDLAPLPPPSATAIGLVRGHDRELGLNDEQLLALRELDEELQAKNLVLENELAALLEPMGPKPGGGPPRGRRGGGPRGGGGMGGGMGGGPPPGGGMGGGPPPGGGGDDAPPRPRRPPPAMTNEQREKMSRIRDEMAENERALLARALDLLDSVQRAKAEALLEEDARSGPPPSFERGPVE